MFQEKTFDPKAAGWKLVFEDEFEGTEVDTNKWYGRQLEQYRKNKPREEEMRRQEEACRVNLREAAAKKWSAKMEVYPVASERPWLVVNEDNDHFFKLDSSHMTREGLCDYLDYVARGHVTHFVMCVSGQRASFDSKTVEPIWEGLGEPCGKGRIAGADDGKVRYAQSGLWAVNAKKLFDAGIDPYEVWTARCREKGVSPWVSMRMNDAHFVAAVTNFFRNTRFARQRRDLWRVPGGKGVFDAALDYAHREVREYALAHLREIASRWDVDGVELDWMRHGLALRPNHERDDAHFITEFMRMARAAVDAAGARRGRRMKLSVRAPRSPSIARLLRFDVVEWAREGLVDVVVGTGFYHVDRDIAVAEWIRELEKANDKVVFLPCIDMVANGRAKDANDRYMNLAQYRYVADHFYKGGAKGLYLFNAPYRGKYDPMRTAGAAADDAAANGVALLFKRRNAARQMCRVPWSRASAPMRRLRFLGLIIRYNDV